MLYVFPTTDQGTQSPAVFPDGRKIKYASLSDPPDRALYSQQYWDTFLLEPAQGRDTSCSRSKGSNLCSTLSIVLSFPCKSKTESASSRSPTQARGCYNRSPHTTAARMVPRSYLGCSTQRRETMMPHRNECCGSHHMKPGQ